MPHSGPHQKGKLPHNGTHLDGFAHQQRHWGQQLCKEKRHWNYSNLPRNQIDTNTNNDINIPLIGFDGFTLPQGRNLQSKKSLSSASLKIPMQDRYSTLEQHLYPGLPSQSRAPTRGSNGVAGTLEGTVFGNEDQDSLSAHLSATMVPVAQGGGAATPKESPKPAPKKPFPRTTYSMQFDGAQNSKCKPSSGGSFGCSMTVVF